MKQIIKSLLTIMIRFWSLFYSLGVSQWWNAARNYLFTLWICNFLGEVGAHSSFSRPLILEGGGHKNVFIGDHTRLGHHCVLGCWKKYGEDYFNPEIFIGNHCIIGEYSHITAINRITIGDGLLTGRFVYIGDNAHGGLSMDEANMPPVRRKLKSKGEIVIGKNVWIGDKAAVLSGVHVGNNVIIAANAVVTKDVPNNCVVGGVPAVILKRI